MARESKTIRVNEKLGLESVIEIVKERNTDLESLTFSHSLFGNAARSTVFM